MGIIKRSIRETTGNEANVAQSFKHNIFFNAKETQITPFSFDVPVYTTVGGTSDYYGQNPLAIFTNLVKPFIRFDFSDNTDSFSSSVYVKHDIYRIDWGTYSIVNSSLDANEDETIQSDEATSETIEEIDEITGEITRKTINRSKNTLRNQIKSNKKPGNLDTDISDQSTIRPGISAIQDLLDTPVASFTASTSGITTNIYDFQPEQFVKNLGEFKSELFQDRAQYFVDTNFIFEYDITDGLEDYVVIDYNEDGDENTLSETTYNTTIRGETTSEEEIISGGSYSGLSFSAGKFFTFFEVPDKPEFEYPTPEGNINTFTPEIFWSNGEGADEYLVQVNYNTGDTGFTGTVFTYTVPKSDEYKEDALSKTKTTSTEFESTKTIRKYQLSLKTNKCLLYRVGNVKYITNIFGVKQSVVTFSENKEICTQAEPIKTFVYVENDSPHTEAIAGLDTPPSLDAESPLEEYTLSGTVSGSTVTGATMQLIYPNTSFVTKSTTSTGEFSFGELEAGTYTLNTTYRGYAVDSRVINISNDTSVFIDLKIRWDNEFDIWAVKESDIIKY